MCKNWIMLDMRSFLRDLLNQRVHKTPPIKLTHPQHSHDWKRASLGQRICEDRLIKKGIPEKDSNRLLHTGQEVAIKAIQQNKLVNRHVQVRHDHPELIGEKGSGSADWIEIRVALVRRHSESAAKADKMHKFLGWTFRSHQKLHPDVEIEPAQHDQHYDFEPALFPPAWKVVFVEQVLLNIRQFSQIGKQETHGTQLQTQETQDQIQ